MAVHEVYMPFPATGHLHYWQLPYNTWAACNTRSRATALLHTPVMEGVGAGGY